MFNVVMLRLNRTRSDSSSKEPFNFQGTYLCPVCRHGHISSLTLMDAFACEFCHHIFTANLTQQTLHAADSSQPMAWKRIGTTWRTVQHGNAEVTGLVWFMAAILIICPPTLVGLAAYMFPPVGGESWSFPLIWMGLTFCTHFTLVGWLLAEYHQYPLYIGLKIRLGRLFSPS